MPNPSPERSTDPAIVAAVSALTIVLDYDGTVTEKDYLDEVAAVFGDAGAFAVQQQHLEGGRLTVNETIRREYALVRAPLAEVVAWLLENVRVRAGFAALVALAEERDWRIILLSSGFREFIEPILDREGAAQLEVYANTIEPLPTGWRVRFADDEPCPACDVPCKRRRLQETAGRGRVAYVGDGHSDLCAAEACDLVFAVSGQRLAQHLADRGIDFRPFETLTAVADGLRAAGV